MSFKLYCPHCSQKLEAEEEWIGQELECPNCSKPVIIEKPRLKEVNEKSEDEIYKEEKLREKAKQKIIAEKVHASCFYGCLLSIAVFVIMIILLMYLGQSCSKAYTNYKYNKIGSNSSNTGNDSAKINAWTFAKESVRKKLKSPSTAKFQWCDTDNVTHLGGNRYKVKGYVDAQNSFGATIRQHYVCTLKITGKSEWVVESLDLN